MKKIIKWLFGSYFWVYLFSIGVKGLVICLFIKSNSTILMNSFAIVLVSVIIALIKGIFFDKSDPYETQYPKDLKWATIPMVVLFVAMVVSDFVHEKVPCNPITVSGIPANVVKVEKPFKSGNYTAGYRLTIQTDTEEYIIASGLSGLGFDPRHGGFGGPGTNRDHVREFERIIALISADPGMENQMKIYGDLASCDGEPELFERKKVIAPYCIWFQGKEIEVVECADPEVDI